MKKKILCLDVGGTEIKTACMDMQGSTIGPTLHFPSNAQSGAEEILTYFVEIITNLVQSKEELSGIHFAFPGPFDYENGICLIQGLDKYDALYGKNLRHEFAQRLNLPPNSIRFCNDVAAFALGEMHFGNASQAERALFVCIGTGCGSAFGVNGRLAPEGTPGVPPHGYLYALPFHSGCIDDYISKRGLIKLTQQYLHQDLEGKELAALASAGHSQARLCFLQFGQNLCDAISPVLEDFYPQYLCIGGQITKSAHWFLQPLEEKCRKMHIELYVTEDTSKRTFQGLTRLSS
ncbi:MAG: ROK family protein [Lachnospiraceae bacterium]